MNEESAFTQQPPLTPKPSNRKRLLIVFVIVLVLLIVGLVALYIIGGTIKRPTPAPLPPAPTALPTLIPTVTTAASTSASVTATPSASATTKLDRAAISVSVQNGSGTPGAAQKYATTLKSAGYTKITTGNADNFDYKGVTVHVTKKYKEYLALLEKDVSTADAKVKVSGSVDDTISTNAEVIVGK